MTDVDSRLTQLIDPETAPVLLSTVRNMRAQQLIGIFDRKLRHLVVPALPFDADRVYERAVPESAELTPETVGQNTSLLRESLEAATQRRYRDRVDQLSAGEVEFLNRAVTVGGKDGVDWFSSDVMAPPELWALKFHGFEFLSWVTLGYSRPENCQRAVNTCYDWLDDWQASPGTNIGTPAYLRRAWTPYAVSLRLCNLARFLAWLQWPNPRGSAGVSMLYRNAAFLSNHIEYDVGGNHLVENGVALLLAGSLLDGDHGDRFQQTGIDVLVDASEQFLDDGGHFELSPMYHVATVMRYLTAVDILTSDGLDIPGEIRRVAESGVQFLLALEPPDGKIPLLNDAVFGEAPTVASCRRYADAVGVDTTTEKGGALPSSGYYWLGSGPSRLLIDGGEIGPSHLPGHSHNDQFAVCFWADGRRLLTDTGTYEYAPTAERQYSRSVEAHNTVQYGDEEPVPIDGSYLMGRQFEPTVTTGTDDGIRYFDGIYTRQARFGSRYTHRRQACHADDWWFVWDSVDAAEPAPVTSRLHVAPDIAVTATTAGRHARYEFTDRETTDSEPLAFLTLLGGDTTSVTTSQYFPSFLQSVPRVSLSVEATGDSIQFGFFLSTAPYRSPSVDHDDTGVTAISVGGQEWPLPGTD